MGVHDIYCVICGLPAHGMVWYGNEFDDIEYVLKTNKKTKTLEQLREDYIKFLIKFKSLIPKFKWMEKNYLITHDRIIENAEATGDYGTDYEGYNVPKFLWDRGTEAIIVHQDCYNLLKTVFNHKLTIDDVSSYLTDLSILKKTKYKKPVSNFTDTQRFPEIGLMINKKYPKFYSTRTPDRLIMYEPNLYVLMSPLRNNQNRERIISIWKNILSTKKSRKGSKKVAKKGSRKGSKKIAKKSSRKFRPSPTESATMYKTGTKRKGNDGTMYIVVENKNNIKRWVKVK